ncbi:MAG TPA: mechanosensitive ion channel domain-containing protein [Steroidobacteraceae bacterium]|nr:mechanosensitive ion channel domain-containing protein [Steroidobacteraceae bacterium]
MAVLTRILLVVACLLLRPALAAEQASEDVDAQAAPDSAPVVVDGVVLFRVAGSASFPAAQRAARASERIVAAANDPSIAATAIKTEQHESRVDIVAGSRHLIGVIGADAAIEGVSGVSVADAALVRAMRVRDAIVRYRAERTPERLVQSALVAGAATAVAALALWLTWVGFRRLRLKLDQRYRKRVHSLSIQSFEVVRAESIWRGLDGALSTVRWLIIAAIVYLLCAFALGQFPWTRSTAERLLDLVVLPLLAMTAGVFDYIPKLIFLVLLFLGVRWFLKLLSLFFEAVGSGRVPLRSFDAEWAQPTYQIVRILLILLALVIAYPYLPGSGSAAFQGLSIFAGLMLSLGASSAMASLIAGYTVTYRRAFRVGDRITVGDLTGEVCEVRLLVTHLRTSKNEEVVVPNSLVLQSHVVNYSKLARSHGLILHTTVSIGYETPWRQVEAMLLLAAERTDGVSRDPAPFVLEKALGDFAVSYELNAYVDSTQQLPQRYAELHRHVLDVFNEYGVQIMTPAYEGDPEVPKVVPQEKWFVTPARAPAAQNMKVAKAIAPP